VHLSGCPAALNAASCRSRLDQLVEHAGVEAVGLTDTAIQLRADPVEQVLWDDFQNGLQVAAGLGRSRRETVPDPRFWNEPRKAGCGRIMLLPQTSRLRQERRHP
jgi:hypothetical protein